MNPPSVVDHVAQNAEPPAPGNPVGLIGCVLAVLSAGLCGLVFVIVDRLPDGPLEFQAVQENGPASLQLLILGCSAAVLGVVALVLSVIGLLLPGRPKTLAGVGAGLSLLLLLGVFGVIVLGILMNPRDPVTSFHQFPRVRAALNMNNLLTTGILRAVDTETS
ncbi:MAG: hypothetical protein R3C49_11460 [Planctomycetaceae bacterium]